MLLASAPIPVSSDSNVELILISAGVVLVVGILAFIPIRLARSRGSRNPDALLAFVILWGLVLAGSVSYSVMRQMDWNSTYQQRLQSGYGNPDDLSDKPKPPVVLWAALGAAYAGMTGWAARPGIKR
jgi:hypothetical protein